jgi:hypothetical protein
MGVMSQRSRGFWPWVLLVVGLVVALIVGLMSPWRLSRVEKEGPEKAALSDFLQDQYIVWVSDSYAASGDLAQAQERLVALGEEETVSAVTELAARQMDSGEEIEVTRRLIVLAQDLGAGDEAMAEYLVATAPTSTPTETAIPTPTSTESARPTATSTPIPTATNTPVPPAPAAPIPTTVPAHPAPLPREWDRRLDWFYPTLRLEEAQVGSGQWYWRLIRTIWWDDVQSRGLHHIYVEVLDENGVRSPGQTVVIEFGGVPHYEPYPQSDKWGEEYAFNYSMTAVVGAYNVYIGGPDVPGDRIIGVGMGTRMEPHKKHHTSFLLTFQRTYQP